MTKQMPNMKSSKHRERRNVTEETSWNGIHAISHSEIKSHRIWPICKAIPIKKSNLTEFSDKFFEEININHTLLWFSQASLGWLGVAKVSCVLSHWGVQLILAYSWARLAILIAGKARGECFYFFCFFPFISVPLSSLPLSFIFSAISFLPFSGRQHKHKPFT